MTMRQRAVTARGVLARHPWLRLEEDGSTLSASAGRHEVRETLVLPAGVRLVIGAGTELVFAADAALVVQGAVEFAGQAEIPVVLRGASELKYHRRGSGPRNFTGGQDQRRQCGRD